LAKTAVALLVIVSVATILISPQTTDDVDGVLQHHFFVIHPVFHTLLDSNTRLNLHLFSSDLAIHRLECLNLLDLVCARLC